MKMAGVDDRMRFAPFGDGPVIATIPRVPCTFGAAETRGYSSFPPAGDSREVILSGRGRSPSVGLEAGKEIQDDRQVADFRVERKTFCVKDESPAMRIS
jgi:hypothetical protein